VGIPESTQKMVADANCDFSAFIRIFNHFYRRVSFSTFYLCIVLIEIKKLMQLFTAEGAEGTQSHIINSVLSTVI
jgi:hypothetical protein